MLKIYKEINDSIIQYRAMWLLVNVFPIMLVLINQSMFKTYIIRIFLLLALAYIRASDRHPLSLSFHSFPVAVKEIVVNQRDFDKAIHMILILVDNCSTEKPT